jgi:hypothetical protein
MAKMHQSQKKSIFDRLTSNESKVPPHLVTSTSQSSSSSSIFKRLGNYKDIEIEKKSIAFSGILKSLTKVDGKGYTFFVF